MVVRLDRSPSALVTSGRLPANFFTGPGVASRTWPLLVCGDGSLRKGKPIGVTAAASKAAEAQALEGSTPSPSADDVLVELSGVLATLS